MRQLDSVAFNVVLENISLFSDKVDFFPANRSQACVHFLSHDTRRVARV